MVAAIAAIIVAATLTAVDLNGGSLDFSGRDVRIIVTDSMQGEPTGYPISTIEKDSVVMVKLLDEDGKKSIQVGDVVQMNDHGILNHHRVLSNDPVKKEIVTKGDNSEAKEYMSYDDISGIVVGKNHLLGQIFTFVKSNAIPIALMILIVAGAFEAVRYIRGHTE